MENRPPPLDAKGTLTGGLRGSIEGQASLGDPPASGGRFKKLVKWVVPLARWVYRAVEAAPEIVEIVRGLLYRVRAIFRATRHPRAGLTRALRGVVSLFYATAWRRLRLGARLARTFRQG